MENFNKKSREEMERILTSDLPEMEKFIQAYDWNTRRIIELAQYEIDLAKAMQDHETAVKHQVKMETLKLARDIFQNCYLQVSGKRTRLWEA